MTWLATAFSLAAARARLAGFERFDACEALGLARKRKNWRRGRVALGYLPWATKTMKETGSML